MSISDDLRAAGIRPAAQLFRQTDYGHLRQADVDRPDTLSGHTRTVSADWYPA